MSPKDASPSQNITFQVRLLDSTSGINYAQLVLYHQYNRFVCANITLDSSHLISGDIHDGTYQYLASFPDPNCIGHLTISMFQIYDIAGNMATAYAPGALYIHTGTEELGGTTYYDCSPDRFDGTSNYGPAPLAFPGIYTDLKICYSSSDWYTFTLPQTMDFNITVNMPTAYFYSNRPTITLSAPSLQFTCTSATVDIDCTFSYTI